MHFYLIFFTICAFFSFFYTDNNRNYPLGYFYNAILWKLIFFFLIIVVGFRKEVGGDWSIYQFNYNWLQDNNFSLLEYLKIRKKEYLFEIIFFVSQKYNLTIYFVNFLCALISFIFLYPFLKYNHDRYLALLICFPILIVVGFMGFTRQGVACSIIFFSILQLFKKQYLKYFLCILIASFFHISALVFILFVFPFLKYSKNIYFILIILIPLIFIIFYFQFDKLEDLKDIYIGAGRFKKYYENPVGAIYRVLLIVIPALIYLLFNKKMTNNLHERNIMLFFSIFVLITSIILFHNYVTLLDRFFYYFIFISVYVFTRLVYLINNYYIIYFMKMSIILVYGLILFVWLVYANHSSFWIPYDNLLF